ncbi:MAG TPA: endonuclease/exonuclease/phosphatase family protein [Acidimicrobiales bacterium]|nr:endonuclease/exonuclease/phosphatase family protein [Acidimicrobiales bacterium]
MRLRLLTWNLKGSTGVDIARVSDHIRASGADVVALQEVQRHQARALAQTLGARSLRWAFKHQPLDTWAEGGALIGVTRAVTHARALALSYGWEPWIWRRRIAVIGQVEGGPTVVNLHLSTGGDGARRVSEVGTALAAAPGRPLVVMGDLNERPGGPVAAALTGLGLRDAWPAGDDPGYTDFHGWTPGTDRPPTQRIDYVYASTGVEVASISVPRFGEPGFPVFAELSDHLPVSAEVEVEAPSPSPQP